MKIMVDMPLDGEWIDTGKEVFPVYGELCIVIPSYGDRCPEVVQFRKADYLHPKADYFLDVGEGFRIANQDQNPRYEWEPGFYTTGLISHWKPLNLPEKVDRNLKEIIEYWFSEEEEDGTTNTSN